MPFKKFPGDQGEARSLPVSFGPSAPIASNGNASNQFRKPVDEAEQAGGPIPWHGDSSRLDARNKSPSRTSGAARAGSPSRSLPLMNGTALSPPLSFRSRAYDQPVITEHTDLPTRLPIANTGRSYQKSPPFVSNSDRGRFSSNSTAQEEPSWIPKSARALPEIAPYSLPNSQGIQSIPRLREPKARNNPTYDTGSRFYASSVQQLSRTTDGSAISLSVEQQRDDMARGRRLRRFNDPASKGIIAGFNFTRDAVDDVATKQDKGISKVVSTMTSDDAQVNLADSEAQDGLIEKDWQSTELILGECPDMCPESERLERERKGDLDKLERVDGDRNQSSKALAVKKYTRTAEKQASLIRPISVLLKTMKHLLHLLNREYDEELLNLHNFLWDRMRAIRMDLRMQHIFNEQAVVMHEQMIRFHILAMHELCEYTKGEGFSEGFDAHLNIEQMNKASVDLFHMYDDLRKSGQICASEAEFRGYYALLKLDKHPGYVVEPAELSLDLAKMTPEMRTAPEVQFARKVARACRSGNYLAFFCLARDATYLQACLMHAHFSKLRSQAMASLHSGLQRNQGIPIAQLEDWLGMEGEDIELLLEYHGFVLRNFEELYMVKEGPFLNQHKPFQTQRSKLVEEKRSWIVEDDVISSRQEKVLTSPLFERVSSLRRQSELQPPTEHAQTDEDMPDYEEEQLQETSLDLPMISSWPQRDEPSDYAEPEINVPISLFLVPDISVQKNIRDSFVHGTNSDEEGNEMQISKRRKCFSPGTNLPKFVSMPTEHGTTSRDRKLATSHVVSGIASPRVAVLAEVKSQFVNADHMHEGEAGKQAALMAEVDIVKARDLLRKWRERVVFKAEQRQWRQQKLEAALSSLHVGLPMQYVEKDSIDSSLSTNVVELDLVEAEDERFERIENMWAKLDVIDVVASILQQKNPKSNFLCWKLVVCSRIHDSDARAHSQHDRSGDWLLAKLLDRRPNGGSDSEGTLLANNSQAASVLFFSQHHETRTPIFYIAKDIQFRHGRLQNIESGKDASGILFLVSESVPLVDEGRRLCAVVDSLPNNAQLPLLILYPTLSAWNYVEASTPSRNPDAQDLAKLLRVDELDKNKIGSWTVLPIMESYQSSFPLNLAQSFEWEVELLHCNKPKGYYNEDLLKSGLTWLASRAPKQPNLESVNIQDLVMNHLQPSLKLLSTMDPANVTPDMCVKVFNEALANAVNDVNSSAADCHQPWPPHELIEASEELSLPSIPKQGWNEASYLRPLIGALSLCQLPDFPLVSVAASNIGGNVSLKRQKAALEHILHLYVNQICGSRHADLLTLQAVHAITQNSCVFKWTVLGRILIPNWAMIFQQLYHIRLALVCSDPPAVVWVQVREKSSSENDGIIESPDLSEYRGPTLDEMIELEYHETAMRSQFDEIHPFQEDHWSRFSKLESLSSFSMVDRVDKCRQANAEALQECMAMSSNMPAITDITTPTEGELDLERMVNDLCAKVDQQATEVAKFENSEAIGCSETQTRTSGHTASDLSNQGENRTQSYRCLVLPGADAGEHAIAGSHLCTDHSSLDPFTHLFQHCENVQNSIDKILKDCFQLGEST